MVGFLLVGALFTLLILVGGAIAWGRADRTGEVGSTRRTRSEAREIQTRVEVDDDFARNFQRPTQNEVLETLQMLDHLSPGWDRGGAALADRRLKNELAEGFPTLRKAGCIYPQDPAADFTPNFGKKARSHAAQTTLARQKFRAERAQANAMHQMTSGVEINPVAVTPDSLPFLVSEDSPVKRTSQGTMVVGLATAALGLVVGGWYLATNKPHETQAIASTVSTGQPEASVRTPPATVAPQESTPAPSAGSPAPVAVRDDTAQNLPPPGPFSSPDLAAAAPLPAAEAPSPSPPITPAPVLPKVDFALAEGVAASKERAVDKYPDLAVPNSEINLRFVFRYKALLLEKSARLQDPGWPEKLADECARAANGTTKTKKSAQAAPRPH